MKKIINCRRSIVCLIGILSLSILGFFKGADVSSGIAGICMGLAGANAGEAAFGKKTENDDSKIK